MFRLIRGEILKIMRQPTIYILTIILSLVITFSFVFYSPQSIECLTYVKNVDMELSVEQMYAKYYTLNSSEYSATSVYKFIEINDDKKDNVSSLINFYQESIAIDDTMPKQKSKREIAIEKIEKIKSDFITLYNTCFITLNSGVTFNFTQADNVSLLLYEDLLDLEDFIKNELNKNLYTPTTSFLVSFKDKNTILDLIKKYKEDLFHKIKLVGYNDIDSSTQAQYTILLNNITNKYFNNFKNTNDYDKNKFNIFELQIFFENNTYDLNLTKNDLQKIQDTYVTSARTILDDLKSDLENYYNSLDLEKDNNLETKEKLLDHISLLYGNGYYANCLAKSLITLKLSEGFTDNKFNEFIGVSSFYNQYNGGQNDDDVFNSYNFKQNISKYSAIYNTKLIELNYATTFSSNKTSNFKNGEESSVNAFDYSFYVLDIFSFIIIIFCVIIASSMIAGEQKDKTLKLLAIRPYTRGQIFRSKVLTTLFFAFIFVLLSVAISLIAGYFMYGINLNDMIIVINATYVYILSPIIVYGFYVLCLFLKILFYVMLAFLISTLLKSYLASAIINLFCLLFATLCNNLFSMFAIWKFLPFANIDVFKYFGSGTFNSNSSIFSSSYIIPGTDLILSLAISLSSIIFFTVISNIIFKKRDIA